MSGSELSVSQRAVLQICFDYFHKVAEWPAWTYVSAKVQQHAQGDVIGLAKSMFPALIQQIPTFNHPNERASLTVEGIDHCDNSEEELEGFLRVLERCVSIYFDQTQISPIISSGDLRETLHMSDLVIDKMKAMLDTEGICTEGSGIGNEWQYRLSSEISRYSGVKTVEQYLNARPTRVIPTPPAGETPQEVEASEEDKSLTETDQQEDLTYDYLWIGGFLHDSFRPRLGNELPKKDQEMCDKVFGEYLRYLAAEMESKGLSPRSYSPFPYFSFLMGITNSELYIIIGRSPGMRLAIYKDLREVAPEPALDQVNESCKQELAWPQTLATSISIDDVNRSSTSRRETLQLKAEETVKKMGRSIQMSIPNEMADSLSRFRADHPDASRTAFIMMQFGKTPAHEKIVKAIREMLASNNIVALRADDKQYHNLTYQNILTYLYGCDFGIAVFERIEKEVFNPNVAFEVGFMMALQKPVCLLKDKTLPQLQTDLVGHLYRPFDPQRVRQTIPTALKQWLTDYGLL